MKKLLFLFAITIFIVYSSSAQDTIFRNNGSIIICKITETNTTTVFYKIATNSKITNSLIPRSEVASIKYGTTKYLNTNNLDQVSLGLGMGQIYGFLGGNLVVYPQRNIGLFAGMGYDLLGLGYNVGAKIRFVKAESSSRVNFFITGMYGYVAVIKITGGEQYDKTFFGPTFGAGVDIPSRSGKGNWNISLLLPVRGTAVQKYMDDLKANHNIEFKNSLSPVTVSIGYMFILN